MERTIIFVCEHGAAKSVVAAAHFNKLAKERFPGVHALARGTNPDEEHTPSAVEGLAKDGLMPEEQKPALLTKHDVSRAMAIISFCDLPDEYQDLPPIESWMDIPPVSADYEAARDAMLARIRNYLDGLNMKP
jgi:protein-tyrosine-phosphatase